MVETQLAQKVPAAAAGRSPPSSKPSVTQAAGKTAGGKGAPVAKAGPASKAGTATAVDVATLLPAGPHKQVGCIKPSSCQPFFEGNIGVPELVRAHGSPMSKSRQVRARPGIHAASLLFTSDAAGHSTKVISSSRPLQCVCRWTFRFLMGSMNWICPVRSRWHLPVRLCGCGCSSRRAGVVPPCRGAPGSPQSATPPPQSCPAQGCCW